MPANSNTQTGQGITLPGAGPKVFLVGFMGCGKSFWGRQLAARLQVPFIDLDDAIEAAEGRPITEIFAASGEEYFRKKEQEVLVSITEVNGTFVLATGGGTPCFFNNIDYMNRHGNTIWLNCPVETLQQRLVGEKDKRPLIRDLSDEQLKTFITKKLGDRKIFYQQAAAIIFEHELNLETMLGKILHEEKY